MSLIDRNIYFEKDSQFELIGSNVNKFLIFSIKKTHYQTIHNQGNQHAFETFLLIKVQTNNSPLKNIVFARKKIPDNKSQKGYEENHFLKSQTFYCSFLRHVDLLYCRKLAQTIQCLSIRTNVPIQNQWFLLYQVHGYKLQMSNLTKYELKSPIYGGKVIISNQTHLKNLKISASVSNLFRLGSYNIYFVNDSINEDEINDMNLVLSANNKQIYGLTYKIKENTICIPLNMILFQKPCETIIENSLFEKLQKTCYIGYLGSYCTGILVEQNKIITARHLLPKHQQKIDVKVLIKKFPFKQNSIGIVTKIGLGHLDIMQIQILDKQYDLKLKTSQNIKSKEFVKQYLTGNLVQDEQQQIISSTNKISKHSQIKKINQSPTNIQQKKYYLGDQITALGFGKFSYNISIFNKFDIILPTVAIGIISKLIEINNLNVFLKTDAKLYSGFSGCGIWKQNMIGMAIFILKNQTTNSHHNRHNFSYTVDFIEELRKNKHKQFSIKFNKQIQDFDRIQTRFNLDLTDYAQSKL